MTRVSRKNQVAPPVADLTAARVSKAEEPRGSAKGAGRIVRQRSINPFDEFVGSVPGLAVATRLEALRDEWDR